MNNIYQKLEIPNNRRKASIGIKKAEFIFNFIKNNKIKKTLEIGLAFGCSAAYIISATLSKHYAIDPFQKGFKNLGIKNLQKLELIDHLVFEEDFSYNALPKFIKEDVKVDFAFIDGSHKFDHIFIDFFYIDKILNQNGYILFDDAWMRSTQHVVSWVRNNMKNYIFIKTPINHFVLIQKIGNDNRNWYHFKGFGTMRSYFSNLWFVMKQ